MIPRDVSKSQYFSNRFCICSRIALNSSIRRLASSRVSLLFFEVKRPSYSWHRFDPAVTFSPPAWGNSLTAWHWIIRNSRWGPILPRSSPKEVSIVGPETCPCRVNLSDLLSFYYLSSYTLQLASKPTPIELFDFSLEFVRFVMLVLSGWKSILNPLPSPELFSLPKLKVLILL